MNHGKRMRARLFAATAMSAATGTIQSALVARPWWMQPAAASPLESPAILKSRQVHEYDTVLKSLLTGSPNSLFHLVTGAKRGRGSMWNYPKWCKRASICFSNSPPPANSSCWNCRANDPTLPVRMAEYALLIWRIYKRFPKMYVLYVGSERLRMPSELDTPDLTCRYTIVDIRHWNAETLLRATIPPMPFYPFSGAMRIRMETVRRILERIAKMKGRPENCVFQADDFGRDQAIRRSSRTGGKTDAHTQ
jgi:hypothetical protein